jgi:hypothetical protein
VNGVTLGEMSAGSPGGPSPSRARQRLSDQLGAAADWEGGDGMTGDLRERLRRLGEVGAEGVELARPDIAAAPRRRRLPVVVAAGAALATVVGAVALLARDDGGQVRTSSTPTTRPAAASRQCPPATSRRRRPSARARSAGQR